MPSLPTFKPYKSGTGYRLHLPAGVDGPKERIITRKKKRDLEEIAEVYQSRYKQEGKLTVALSKQETLDAGEALQILSPFNVTLIEAAKFFVDSKRRQSKSITLEEAFKKYCETLKVKRRTKKYISDYTNTLNILEDYKEVLLCDIIAEDIESIFDKLPTSSRDAHLRKLKAVVNYAQKKKFIDNNLFKSIELIGSGGKDVEIFTNAQVKLILKYVAEKEIDYLPYIAVLFFAGVRPEGCQKLKWSDFTKDGRIHLSYTINKGNKDGLTVDVNKTLSEWLSWYFSQGKNQTGMLLEKTADELRGFRRRMEVDLKRRDPNYAWIQDAPRRNFCSAYTRIHGEQEAVKATGHVDIKMLRKHYKKNIELSDAQEYWDITPIALGL